MLTQAGSLGDSIYTEGLENHTANLSDGISAPSLLFPCANCHGRWGEGSQEGGVVAPNITWSQLSKPYSHSTTRGRSRNAYTLDSLVRVIQTGVDSTGQNLATIMPRYDYTEAQIKSLLQTLKHLSQQNVAGVKTNTLKIGLVLGQLKQRYLIIQLLQTYFHQINLNGGIFRRNIQLILEGTEAYKAQCCVAMLAYSEQLFPNWSSSITRIAVFSAQDSTSNTYKIPAFSLYPGKMARQRLLENYLKKNLISKQWTVKPPELELVSKRGQADYLQISQQAHVSSNGLAEQLWMLSVSKLLIHALNKTGRELDSQKLTDALSQTHDFQTHFGPSLSFGAQRYIGALGGMIKQKSSENEWIWYQSK